MFIIYNDKHSKTLLTITKTSLFLSTYSIFISNQTINNPMMKIFVNDLHIFAPHGSKIIPYIKSELIIVFEIIDIGSFLVYVGLKITQNQERRIIKLYQLWYIKKSLDCHSILKVKTAKVLIYKIIFLSSNKTIFELKNVKYAVKVGSIIYATVET